MLTTLLYTAEKGLDIISNKCTHVSTNNFQFAVKTNRLTVEADCYKGEAQDRAALCMRRDFAYVAGNAHPPHIQIGIEV